MAQGSTDLTLGTSSTGLSREDEVAVTRQLGREPRGAQKVAWRCPCGKPGVVMTSPRLPNGVPFPTTYYLTCPNAVKAISTLEGSGLMAQMAARLGEDPALAGQYAQAHQSYLEDRADLASRLGLEVPEIDGVSAGGMPHRVKCLHALAAQSLAKGPGVNPFGDEALALIGPFWDHPCGGGAVVPEDSGAGQ
ncbi:MAG: DUF501 domain-containing protein [Propionibacteriaceae bacterium]|nr:DUF501 domain-containing protein [Propionibacteriaceae bacterium]